MAARQKNTPKKSRQTKKQQDEGYSAELQGWFLLASALTLIISLLNFTKGHLSSHWLGLTGYMIAWMFTGAFGLSSYILAVYIGWVGWRRLFNKTINHPLLKHLYIGVLMLSVSMLLSLLEDQFPELGEDLGSFFYAQLWEKKLHFHLGGAPAFYFYKDMPTFNLLHLINAFGVAILFTGTLVSSLLLLMKTKPQTVLDFVVHAYATAKEQLKSPPKVPVLAPVQEQENSILRYVKVKIPKFTQHQEAVPADHDLMQIHPEKNLIERPSISRKESKDGPIAEPFEGAKGTSKRQEMLENQVPLPGTKTPTAIKRREAALVAQRVHNGDFEKYKLPPTTLLSNPKKVDQASLKSDLRRQAEVLEETLQSFGIEAKVGQINCGPTITSFEVHPAIGVKVQKIKALENDIALNMEAKSIRILAPIPGKAAIGIEVPNPQPQEVGFKDMLNAYLQNQRKFQIPILLGKTVTGEYVMEDLAKMPHVIIAGATGSGKSVCINTIIMAILMSAKPDEIKLIMVDPKKVELTPYSRLPHMLAPVITEPAGACAALNWLVKEMENRYEILKLVGQRNITGYNERKIDKAFEESLEREFPVKMHYIVCIIDELADLMMVSSNDMETYIARIAQMARAVGIHLILATQRPSREVITGLIKANFPTRISFKVSSRVNSQIILDEIGAESLLGNGDMLFLPPGSHHLLRAQGAYIRDEDINQVIENICSQAPTNYMIASFDDHHSFDSPLSNGGSDLPKDDLYDEALEVLMSTGNASTTFLQRKLKIGYARAASIIDQLEADGIVGPAQGAKPREILRKAPAAFDE